MRNIIVAVTAVGLAAASLVGAPPAFAGSVSAGGVSVNWDDSSFYTTMGCSSFNFNYINPSGAYTIEVEIKNRYGDSLGSEFAIASPAGTMSVQVCERDSNKFDGTQVELQVAVISGGGVTRSVGSAPITFMPRPAPAPSSSATITPPKTPAIKMVFCRKKGTKTFRQFERYKCPSGWRQF